MIVRRADGVLAIRREGQRVGAAEMAIAREMTLREAAGYLVERARPGAR